MPDVRLNEPDLSVSFNHSTKRPRDENCAGVLFAFVGRISAASSDILMVKKLLLVLGEQRINNLPAKFY
jgi:hypothetical protein